MVVDGFRLSDDGGLSLDSARFSFKIHYFATVSFSFKIHLTKYQI